MNEVHVVLKLKHAALCSYPGSLLSTSVWKMILLLGPKMTPAFSLRVQVYIVECSNPLTWTGLHLPQYSRIIVGTWSLLLLQESSTGPSVTFQEKMTSEDELVALVIAANPSGTPGTKEKNVVTMIILCQWNPCLLVAFQYIQWAVSIPKLVVSVHILLWLTSHKMDTMN